ncbi:MAG: dihydrodipicolinate synthase family protein [Peptoniphilus sp.]|uniref:dihydrodipicolinate synthase family protein n=1 Tax=Peptoniphilus sp. TaxID=1971214 RepID=UPI0025EFFCBA|nr:dihydrodipicolinate synthase family protein [Peptoniphilus sp.]MCI5643783.1 dihydrodipicolinate synthase family protein [Peptoniphilus sp.]MDD7353104.1 dihydrodipicolinate synthase family protein [Peptoniphilaceae bacterium]
MKAKIITPTVTIFDNDGNVDIEGNRLLIQHLIDNGVDGAVPLGSSGEFTALSMYEKKKLIKLYVDESNGKLDLIPGTSSLNIEECVELSNYAISLGVKGVLILPPFYYGISQEEAFHYYDVLAQKIDGNIYIYNFSARTGFDMSAKTTFNLAKKHKNIKGMKDSTANLTHTKEVILKVKEIRNDFEVYSGFDDHFIPNIIAGGSGCIAAISNFEPKLWSSWVKAINSGNFEEVKAIGNIIDRLMPLYSVEKNFSHIFKKFLIDDGLKINDYTIFPFEELSEQDYEFAKKLRNKVMDGR